MGGSIRVIVREESGKVHKMVRWTNQLPYFVKNKRFFESDKNHIDEYVNRNDSYKMNNYDIMAPDGYGIVVFDFKKKKILSSQSYCGFDDFRSSELYLSKNSKSSINFDLYNNILEMRDNNMLIYNESNDETNEIYEVEPFDIDEFIDSSHRKFQSAFIQIDYNKIGWQLIDNGDSIEDEFNIYETMFNDGFKFTYEDNLVWEESLKLHDDFENDLIKEGVYLNYVKLKREDKLKRILKTEI